MLIKFTSAISLKNKKTNINQVAEYIQEIVCFWIGIHKSWWRWRVAFKGENTNLNLKTRFYRKFLKSKQKLTPTQPHFWKPKLKPKPFFLETLKPKLKLKPVQNYQRFWVLKIVITIITRTVTVTLSVKYREAVNSNFWDFGFTGLGVKPKSTASEAIALLTRPSELLLIIAIKQKR